MFLCPDPSRIAVVAGTVTETNLDIAASWHALGLVTTTARREAVAAV